MRNLLLLSNSTLHPTGLVWDLSLTRWMLWQYSQVPGVRCWHHLRVPQVQECVGGLVCSLRSQETGRLRRHCQESFPGLGLQTDQHSRDREPCGSGSERSGFSFNIEMKSDTDTALIRQSSLEVGTLSSCSTICTKTNSSMWYASQSKLLSCNTAT